MDALLYVAGLLTGLATGGLVVFTVMGKYLSENRALRAELVSREHLGYLRAVADYEKMLCQALQQQDQRGRSREISEILAGQERLRWKRKAVKLDKQNRR